jgi:hypothetical protein
MLVHAASFTSPSAPKSQARTHKAKRSPLQASQLSSKAMRIDLSTLLRLTRRLDRSGWKEVRPLWWNEQTSSQRRQPVHFLGSIHSFMSTSVRRLGAQPCRWARRTGISHWKKRGPFGLDAGSTCEAAGGTMTESFPLISELTLQSVRFFPDLVKAQAFLRSAFALDRRSLSIQLGLSAAGAVHGRQERALHSTASFRITTLLLLMDAAMIPRPRGSRTLSPGCL